MLNDQDRFSPVQQEGVGRLRTPLRILITDAAWPGRGYRAWVLISDSSGHPWWKAVVRRATLDRRVVVLEAIWRALGWIRQQRLSRPRVEVFSSDPEIQAILAGRAPVPRELGQWYLLVRSLSNALGKVRFRMAQPREEAGSSQRQRSLALFG